MGGFDEASAPANPTRHAGSCCGNFAARRDSGQPERFAHAAKGHSGSTENNALVIEGNSGCGREKGLEPIEEVAASGCPSRVGWASRPPVLASLQNELFAGLWTSSLIQKGARQDASLGGRDPPYPRVAGHGAPSFLENL